MNQYLIAKFILSVLLLSVVHAGEVCKLNKNYDISGGECRAWGDPHWIMFSGGKHQFMGQLAKKSVKGKYEDSFYYVARCEKEQTVKDMPFQIIGTHFYVNKAVFDQVKRGTGRVDLLDYVTIEFVGTDNQKYYLFFNGGDIDKDNDKTGDILAWVRSTCNGASINYDETMSNANRRSVNTINPKLRKGGSFTIGGFTFTFKPKYPNWIFMKVPYNGKTAVVEIHMRSYNYKHYVPVGRNNARERFWQDFRVKIPAAFKCHTCGLCGQFTSPGRGSDAQKKQMVKECDGHWVSVRNAYSEESYDPQGWTYEYNFFNDQCGAGKVIDHDRTKDEEGGHLYKCPEWKQKKVDVACDAALNKHEVEVACDMIEECEEMKASCKVDACFGGDKDTNIRQIAKQTADDIMDTADEYGFEEIAHLKDVSKSLFKASVRSTGLENPNNPKANAYSIIGQIEKNKREYLNDEGYYKFLLVYKYDNDAIPTSRLEWMQKSWITEKKIRGFKPIAGIVDKQNKNCGGYCFVGLGLSDHATWSYLDGNGGSKYWWNSVGIIKIYNNGIPAFNAKTANSFKLYIEKQEGGGGGYGYAAKGDVIDVDDQQINDDEDVMYDEDDDVQFEEEPQNEEYGGYDEEKDDDMFDDGDDGDGDDDDDDVVYDDDDDVQFEEEPQNEEYGAYDDDEDEFVDYEEQPKYIPYYVPVQQPVAPSMFTLDNILMASLVVMVISMTVSITLCCMRRSAAKQITKKYTAVRTFNDEDVGFVN